MKGTYFWEDTVLHMIVFTPHACARGRVIGRVVVIVVVVVIVSTKITISPNVVSK